MKKIIAKLRDAASETEAYHKRIVAAKDAEIERLKNDLADALDMKVGKGPTALSWQADRIEKQSAALKLARESLCESRDDVVNELQGFKAHGLEKAARIQRAQLERHDQAIAAIDAAIRARRKDATPSA